MNYKKYHNLLNSFILFSLLCFISCKNSTETEELKLTANAGTDQITISGSYVVFNPTKSAGDFSWYEWQQDENNPEKVKIYSDSKQTKDEWNIHKVVFIKEGVYKFGLIVKRDTNDYNGASEPDTLIITVNPNTNPKFEDPNLEAIIRAKLNKQTEELDENTLLELDSLSVAEAIPLQNISSLKGLENCKNLTWLHLGSQNITDISPLESLTKLKTLWLDQNRTISDVTPLAGLVELEELNLDSNLLTDISPLKNLVKLKYLNLQLNVIEDISAIKNMRELKTFELFRASISDLSPLNDLTNLTQLWIVDSKLSDITTLSNLVNIKNLHLAWNQIEDISALGKIKSLEWVALEKNNISDLTALKDLQNLRYVRLWDNKISDIKPLVDNPDIGKGDIVGLNDNLLSETSVNNYIPVLQARGVYITW